jgi:nucleoside-diphosphate-sugar epimerase
MRVFVTGASGWIGSATVPLLIEAGHEVVGLARSEASAAVIEAARAEAHRGTLEDLDSLRKGASGADAVIHLAFIHDFTQMEANAQVDRRAVEVMGAVYEGSDRPLVIASGIGALGGGAVKSERDTHDLRHPLRARGETEALVLSLADRGVRSSSVRLPPTVHGDGDHGFMATLVSVARDKGVAAYVGDGANRWPAVHRADAARLFTLALDGAPAGTALHGVAEEGVALRDVAEVIGTQLDVPVVSIAPEGAIEHFGWLGMLLGADLSASSAITRELLGWEPTHLGLLADLEAHYFDQPH